MLNKREFLQLTGAGLALPWLELLQPAFGGERQGGTNVKAARCVFIHIPFGVNMWRWFPKEFGPGVDLGPTLAPLQHRADQVTVFSGLRHKNAGGHGESGLFLTGNPNYSGGKLPLTGNTISIDQHIAAACGRETSIPSLVLSMAGGPDTISWDARGTAMYGLCDLPLIYEKLFGSAEVLARGKRHQSILNVVAGDMQRLSQNLGREDARRLSQYADAIASVDAQLVRDRKYYQEEAQEFTTTAPGLSLNANKLDNLGREAYVDTLYDLAALALQSDRTRVITIESPFSQRVSAFDHYPELFPKGMKVAQGWHGSGHNLSQKNEADTPIPAEYLANIDRYWVSKLARFLDRLAGIDHDGATLLDHTVVMFGSGMSWGNHMPDQLPLLIAGGSALGIKHQGHIGYNDRDPHGKHLPKSNASDLLRTISEVCGVPAEGFGESVRVLDELLI
ncbi:DUF1552 domain-containing protein [Lignipirellula cremea]|uniref:DUF1552 domain-containing protein n=1 Tax=Lignipirellula cremea TaxID=2528010 RepID=A0A518DXK6_9BACT|nr:DUF1552 domain-containing protein [Lignipirellula cremea]QDU96558.1 hypothetical protein Pla8534_43790 [Lignipirellula cremea]